MQMKTVSRCWQVARCFNRPPLSPTPQNLRHRQTDVVNLYIRFFVWEL
jgi:hypothetical protein